MHNFVELMKKIAMNVFNESKPVAIEYGSVESITPLSIRIDQKKALTEKFLILGKNVQDYIVSASINGIDTNVEIKNSLKVDETVILLRMQGGQKYLVLDRM
ncbi:DUF2577 domain-containing protein [Romboutsia sp. MSSM.1001216sp_RTP31141st1_G3_RTP31141_220114]|uniref:DUF2577 domain-containing protein n=1 Tax=unclassified Romboutsia TaxID=2626894 RepID=UPI0031B5B947